VYERDPVRVGRAKGQVEREEAWRLLRGSGIGLPRFERRVKTNLELSGLPRPKTLEDFDFDAQPQVPKETVAELATLRFLHNGENVLLLGPCGVGKTHLATGLALKAIERGHRIYFLTLHDLVTRSRARREKNRLDSLLRVLTRPEILILHEVGYLPLEQPDAAFLLEVVNKRYQAQKSIIITSNKSEPRRHPRTLTDIPATGAEW